MELGFERLGTQLIINLIGRIDTLSAKQFEDTMAELLAQGENDLIGDCTRLEYISSSALRVMLMTLKNLKSKNGRFSLFGLQPQIKEVFDISGFLDLFEIHDTRDESLDRV